MLQSFPIVAFFPSPMDVVLFLHSNLKHQAKHHMMKFPGVLSNVSNFPSGAGRVSISIYSGSGRVRNVSHATVGTQVGCSFKYCGYGRLRVCKIRPVQDSGTGT